MGVFIGRSCKHFYAMVLYRRILKMLLHRLDRFDRYFVDYIKMFSIERDETRISFCELKVFLSENCSKIILEVRIFNLKFFAIMIPQFFCDL